MPEVVVMEKIKISVLFWEEQTPESVQHDEVVEQVAAALTENGHKVSLIAINDDLRELLDKLDEKRPDLVFNLCEQFADNDDFEMNITAVLELLGQPFTGSGPSAMALRQDKALTKQLLSFQGVPYPQYAIFDKKSIELAGQMRFPLIVKPLRGDTSCGIESTSVVNEYNSLIERIAFIHDQIKVPALVEEYIEGREFYAGILGNKPQEILPIMELDFGKLPPGTARVYGHEAKTDETSEEYKAVNAVVATELAGEVRARIIMAAQKAAYALKVTDYARVDIRLTSEGVPMVVEVNANPYLESTSAFPLAALQAGMGYNTLINKIAEIAWKRLEPSPLMKELQKQRAARAKARKELIKTMRSCEPETGKKSKSLPPKAKNGSPVNEERPVE
jgi:D-alanine-D-alanine ligase